MTNVSEISAYLKSIGHNANDSAIERALHNLSYGESVVIAWVFNSMTNMQNKRSYDVHSREISTVVLITQFGRMIYGSEGESMSMSESTSLEKGRPGFLSAKFQLGDFAFEVSKNGFDKLTGDIEAFLKNTDWQAIPDLKRRLEEERRSLIAAAREKNREKDEAEAAQRKAASAAAAAVEERHRKEEELRKEEERRKAEERRIKEEELRRQALERRQQEITRKHGELAKNAYYEYTVYCIQDTNSGILNPIELNNTLSKFANEGWHLVSIFTNEAGKHSNSHGYGGYSSGTNATIDITYLIFERCIKGSTHPVVTAPLSTADEIEKLHGLMERGIITKEEFDTQKAKLLS